MKLVGHSNRRAPYSVAENRNRKVPCSRPMVIHSTFDSIRFDSCISTFLTMLFIQSTITITISGIADWRRRFTPRLTSLIADSNTTIQPLQLMDLVPRYLVPMSWGLEFDIQIRSFRQLDLELPFAQESQFQIERLRWRSCVFTRFSLAFALPNLTTTRSASIKSAYQRPRGHSSYNGYAK